jgi:shikimate dehydrogenase
MQKCHFVSIDSAKKCEEMQQEKMYNEKPLVLGLLGYPISHSFSPAWFQKKFIDEGIIQGEYRLFGLPSLNGVRSFMEAIGHLVGFNVTIPHKKVIIPYLDLCSEEAIAIGAVNTVLIRNGKWEGYNTDAKGFEVSLSNYWPAWEGAPGLILGSGGASAAAAYIMHKHGMKVDILNRGEILGLPAILPLSLDKYRLIVNATPIGMYPNVDEAPSLPYDRLLPEQIVYDMVYNPEKTLFLTLAEKSGAQVLNGKDMLRLQAEEAWNIWKHYWLEC